MSEKTLDNKERWRNKTVAFRMSPEEAAQLDTFVRISGLTKQDYLIRRALHKEVTVVGSSRVYKALKNQLSETLNELKRIEAGQGVDEELLEVIHLMEITLDGMKDDKGKLL